MVADNINLKIICLNGQTGRQTTKKKSLKQGV